MIRHAFFVQIMHIRIGQLATITDRSVEDVNRDEGWTMMMTLRMTLLIDSLDAGLDPMRRRYVDLERNQDYVDGVMREGSRRVVAESAARMETIKRFVGL